MKRINLLKILKAKIPYFLTGLLVVAVVCAAIFSPEVYFRIEDWAAEANPQTEYVTLQGRTSSDFSTTEKLEILGYLDLMNLSSYSDDTIPSPKGQLRLSRTFIASGNEIPRSDLSATVQKELNTICTYFDPNTHVYALLSEFAQEVMSHIPSGRMYEIVSLAASSYGFVVWDLTYFFDNCTCYILLDAVTGRIYRFDLHIDKSYLWGEGDILQEDNDSLVRDLYQLATKYLEMLVPPANTRYSEGNVLGCDSQDFQSSVELSYDFASWGDTLSISVSAARADYYGY